MLHYSTGVLERWLFERFEEKVGEKGQRPARSPAGRKLIVLEVLIYEDGSVDNMRVLSSNAPHPDYVTAAKNTIRFWRYHPPIHEDCPVSAYFAVAVDFSPE